MHSPFSTDLMSWVVHFPTPPSASGSPADISEMPNYDSNCRLPWFLLYAGSSTYFELLPLDVNLPSRNSCARLATMRSPVPIRKFPNTNPTPRFECG